MNRTRDLRYLPPILSAPRRVPRSEHHAHSGSRHAAFALALVVLGCGSVRDRHPLPVEFENAAQIPGILDARAWGDAPVPVVEQLLREPEERIRELFSGVYGREYTFLAISGGGENGAFGAGLLCGWTKAGTRPEFTVVTGISTGALTAPFAFLGADHDAELEEVFTKYSTKDLIEERGILTILGGDSFASTKPLAKLIAHYMNEDILDAIGAEHRKGRRLLIGTTNLDAGRPVIWNIGAIANSGAPQRVELFQKILLASASIPIAFPPVYFEVEAGGQRYDEMHVDGGATAQVFLLPIQLDWDLLLERLAVPGRPMVYVIRNAKLNPVYQDVDPGLKGIASRSVDSLIRTQGIGDLFKIYLQTQEQGLALQLAYIPPDFDIVSKEAFDRDYMRALFARGHEMARSGYPWQSAPPDSSAKR